MKTLLKNAWLLDKSHTCTKGSILVEDGRITNVEEMCPDAGAEVIDLAGYTVMPGFIDAHVHACGAKPYDEELLRAWAYNGVTTVRDLGLLMQVPLEDYLSWLHAHTGSLYTHVVTAGKYIDIPGGYGCGPQPEKPVGIIISSPESAADAVSYEVDAGVDCIKIGIADDFGPGGPRAKLPPEYIKAICDRAHELGIHVTAHNMAVEDFERLAHNGIDDSAHIPCDRLMSEELIREQVGKGITFITTIGDPSRPYPPDFPDELKAVFAEKRKTTIANIKAIYNAGGHIAIGSDFIHYQDCMSEAKIPTYELTQLYEAGIPFEALVEMATINGAVTCGTEKEEGSLKPDKLANLIAFQGNIFGKPEMIANPKLVMNRGTIIRSEL